MKILIVEDEPFVAEDLREKLETLGHEVTGTAESYDEALEEIGSVRPDVVLVDIELKGNRNGIELSEQLNKKGLDFIYISSLEDLEVYYKAKTTGPAEYLPKPVNILTLRNALLDHESAIADMKSRKMHFFPDRSGIKKRIEASQVVYIEADTMYCDVYFADGSEWTLSVPMGTVVKDLDHPDLVKIHRSYVINRNFVTGIAGSKVQMSVGPLLSIARPYKEAFNNLIAHRS